MADCLALWSPLCALHGACSSVARQVPFTLHMPFTTIPKYPSNTPHRLPNFYPLQLVTSLSRHVHFVTTASKDNVTGAKMHAGLVPNHAWSGLWSQGFCFQLFPVVLWVIAFKMVECFDNEEINLIRYILLDKTKSHHCISDNDVFSIIY